jgi:hypothetical protein
MAQKSITDSPVLAMGDAWSDVEPPSDDQLETAPPASNATDDSRAPESDDNLEDAISPEPEESGGWTIAVLCAGIAIIGACLLLPLVEVNHQLAWQKEKLGTDLEQIKQQVEVNAEFLRRVNDDPTLAERLARRQMKVVRQGTSILDLRDARTAAAATGADDSPQQASPFQLVMLPPPSPMPPYRPMGGALMSIVLNSRVRLYLIGFALLLMACGLVLGGGHKQTFETA